MFYVFFSIVVCVLSGLHSKLVDINYSEVSLGCAETDTDSKYSDCELRVYDNAQ